MCKLIGITKLTNAGSVPDGRTYAVFDCISISINTTYIIIIAIVHMEMMIWAR